MPGVSKGRFAMATKSGLQLGHTSAVALPLSYSLATRLFFSSDNDGRTLLALAFEVDSARSMWRMTNPQMDVRIRNQ